MRISTKLMFAALVPLIVALVVSLALVYSYRTVVTAQANGSMVRQIRSAITELNHLAFSYVSYHEERPKQQFSAAYDSLAGLIANARFQDPEQRRLLEDVRVNSQSMRDLFLKLVSIEHIGATGGDNALSEAEAGLVGQLLTRSHRADSSAAMLRDLTDKVAGKAQQRATALIFIVLIFATVPLTILMGRTRKSVTKSLINIRKGIEVTGSGDLEHRLAMPAMDELGELARSFDTMTEQLQVVTVSKERLEQEIQERRRAEEELRENRERLRVTLGSIGDAIISTDATGSIVFMNAVAEEVTGWTLGDALKKPITEVFHIINEHTRSEVESPVMKVFREGIIVGLANHTVLIRKDRTEVPIDDSGAPIRDGDGKITGVVLVFRDITERKRMEDELRKSRDDLELRVEERTEALRRQADLLELAHDAILVRDMESKIIFWNHGAEDMYGWKKDEAMGAVIHNLLETRFPVPLDDVMTILMQTGKWEGQLEHITKDGRKIQVLSRHALQRDSAGHPVGIMEINLDVTAARQMEEQLRQSQKMEAIGTLAGGIAHDFNNILAAILGFTEMAIDDASDGRSVDKSLQNVHKSTLRARDLVKQILTFSRKTSYDRAPVSLSPLVKETVQLLRASIPATIEIKLSITAASDTVLAAPTEAQQIIMNLATNASLAMEETGGVLDISLSDINYMPNLSKVETDLMPGNYVQLAVKDTGTGMSPDVMRRVFEPFFTTRELGSGTGMGLAVVYGIVTDLEGTITVESEPGIGSTFRVFLPKIKADVKEEDIGALQIPKGTESILFVDDEDMLVEWAKAAFEKLGYRAATLTDPAEALKIFTSDPSHFDLVITDQAMPAMSGMQLAGELLAIRPDIPIILCTGHSATVSPGKAKKAGIKEFLMKPLTRHELAQAVRRALDARRED